MDSDNTRPDAVASSAPVIEPPALIVGMPNAVYHATSAVGSSTLRKMLRSPAHSRVPTAPSDAMDLGTAFHLAMEIGAAWRERYAVRPVGLDGRTKDGKAWAADAAASGLPVIKGEDAALIDAGRAAALAAQITETQTIGDLLALPGVVFERSHFVRDEQTGLVVKVRPDVEILGTRIILDWKYTKDAREHAFTSTATALGYDVQGATYLDHVLEPADLFAWVAVENTAPSGVQVYTMELGSDEYKIGRDKWRRALDLYAHCLSVDEWPCYDPTPRQFRLQRYAYNQEVES